MKANPPYSILLLAGMVAPAAAQAAGAQAKTYELGYFLPKVRAGVAVAQRLVSCPAMANGTLIDPNFETSIAIASKSVPDPSLIRVNAKKGFLAKRTTELRLRPDGTMESFNATNEGQGGVVVSALIKVTASVATKGLALDDGTPPSFDCSDEAKGLLAEREQILAAIARLQGDVAAGDVPDAATALASEREALKVVDEALTVTSVSPVIEPQGSSLDGFVYIKQPDARHLFTSGAALDRYIRERHPGRHGFGANWSANAAIAKALVTSIKKPTDAVSGLYYRRPVPATVAVFPCAAVPENGQRCTEDESLRAGALKASGTAAFPQLSGYFTIPIGRGGLFGSEEAIAEFDANGAPTRLKYGSDGGADSIASVIDTARATYVGLEKADATAQQARLDELKRRKEIRELENALSKPLS